MLHPAFLPPLGILAAFCLALPGATGAERRRPDPFQPAFPELSVTVTAIDAARLAGRDPNALSTGDIRSLATGWAGQFRVPLQGTSLTRSRVGQRVPVTLPADEKKSPGAVRLSYTEVGFDAEAGGTWDPQTRTARVKVAFKTSVLPPSGSRRTGRSVSVPFSTEEELKPDVPKRFVFTGRKNEGDTDAGTYLAALELKAPRDGGPATTAPSQSEGPSQATLRMQVLQVLVPMARFVDIDTRSLIEGEPDYRELLQRMGKLGDASLLLILEDACDLASYRMTSGQRAPVVQDIVVSRAGTVTPSVTYEETGCIVSMTASHWTQAAGAWVCTPNVSLEASSIAQSGVTVSEKVMLPSFLQFKTTGQRTFVSGQPQYLVSSGTADSGLKSALVPVHVIRMELTRPAAPPLSNP